MYIISLVVLELNCQGIIMTIQLYSHLLFECSLLELFNVIVLIFIFLLLNVINLIKENQ